MSQQALKLTATDKDLVKTFRTLCKIDDHKQFSSDVFRMYNLDRFIRDKQHGIGGFFAKLVKAKLIRKVGWTRSKIASNNMRAIRLYEWEETQ